MNIDEIRKRIRREEIKSSNHLSKFLIFIILTLVTLIVLKSNPNIKKTFKEKVLSKNFSFAKINKVFKPDEYDEIVTDISDVYDDVVKDFPNVRLYEDKSFGLDKLYSLRTALDEALDRNVWLKCGGFLIFDKTEAMTVIDVNSGKYTPSKGTDKESAYMAVNIEAAVEICRQLRLRNISGIIIIDFINLKSEDDQNELLEVLRSESEDDTETVMVLDITQLGLVELTRKKELPPLYEQLK